MHPHRPTLLPALLAAAVATALASSAAHATKPVPPTAPVANGASVFDPVARQIWQRCVEGMQWDGKTCTGTPLRMTRAEASARAKALAQQEGLPWRLPRVPELRRLTGKPPSGTGLDPVLFPAAPDGWHWSVTANINTSDINTYDYANIAQGRTNANTNRLAVRQGWAVDMATGEARGTVDTASQLPVRLVRAQP